MVVLRDGTALVFLGLARQLSLFGGGVRSVRDAASESGSGSPSPSLGFGLVAEGCTAFVLGPCLTVAALWASMLKVVGVGVGVGLGVQR